MHNRYKDTPRSPRHHKSTTLLALLPLIMSAVLSAGCKPDKEIVPVPDMEVVDMEVVDMEVDMTTTIDNRCPNARTGINFVVWFSDRVELFTQDEIGFSVSHLCTFMTPLERGASEITSVALGADNNFAILVPEGEAGGSIYIYSNNGEYLSKEGPNINLKDATRIWPVKDKFIVWVERNGSLYEVNGDGSFIGPYTPPQAGSTRLTNLTDMEYIGADSDGNDRLLTLYSDRSPKLFAFPDSPELEGVSGANAVAVIDTAVGKKLLISGEVQGDTKGVVMFGVVNSGRRAPEKEEVVALEVDPGYGNGYDITSFEGGFYILDQGESGGRASGLNSFSTSGIPQEQSPLGVEGTPLGVIFTQVFSDF